MASGQGAGRREILDRAAVSSGIDRSLGNLVPDFGFPFLDDLCRLLICKIVMAHI